MRHYHFVFEAHNGMVPGVGLLEPTSLDFIMESPDLDAAIEKSKSWVGHIKSEFQLEKIFEHEPHVEQDYVVRNQHSHAVGNGQ